MNELLSLIGGVIGLYCAIHCMERLGKISWFNARAVSVLMYLAGALWSLWIVKDAFDMKLEWYQIGSLVFVTCFLWITRMRWKSGVPVEVSTKPGALNGPEFKHTK